MIKKSSNIQVMGNTKAVNQAAKRYFEGGKTTRALRFIPLSYVGQPCMRIEICGCKLYSFCLMTCYFNTFGRA
jgi:hypothetical protein